jgi:hypothetical protein
MRLVDDTLAVDCGGNGRAERLRKCGQLRLGVDGSPTGEDHRLDGGREHLGRPTHYMRIWLRCSRFRCDPRLTRPLLLQHVDGISICTGGARPPVKKSNASVAAAVIMLVSPGPLVATTTPGLPVNRA